MSIDIDKNKTHILQVYNYVLDDKSPTDWALFGYEGQTNVLKVVGYGDDGLEELAEELNASKIMYGVIRIQDPKTSRTKIILLNWQGEGAPNLRKGICSRHLSDVKRMLKGVHITLSARTEDDVETEAILDALSKATSTEYNFKDRSEIPDKNVPVKNLVRKFWSGDVVCDEAMGTNYKRTNPQSEIDANRRNKFWEEQEAEEKVRKEEEIKKREEEAKRLERERLEREIRDSKHREEVNKERNARIFADKKAEMSAIENTRKLTGSPIWKKEDENQKREEEEVERARRADMMRMERKKEAESLIGHKTHHARSVFETQWSQSSSKSDSTQAVSKAPSRKLLKEFNPNNTDVSLSSQRENSVPKKSVGTRWPPPSDENVPEQRKTVPGKITEWKPERVEVTESENHQINSFQEQASSGVELSFKGRSSFLHQNNTSQHATKDSDVLDHTHPYQTSAHAISPTTHHHQSYAQFTTPVTTPVATSATSPVSVAFPSSPVEASPPAAFSNSPQISPHSGGDKSPSSSYAPASPHSAGEERNGSHYAPASPHSAGEERNHGSPYAPASPHSGGERNHGSPYAPASPHSGGERNHGRVLPSETSGERGHSSPPYDKFSSSDADPKTKEADSYRTNGGLSHYEDEEDVPYTTEEHDEFGPVSMTYEVDGIEYQILPEHGICARALYDYQAADDTEITFDPGDIITNIDQIDVGWWQGVSPMGVFGLFPANYVELINGNKIH